MPNYGFLRRESWGHCGVRSPSEPDIEAPAAKTQEGDLGSEVSSHSPLAHLDHSSPRGDLGDG